jgi:hypothetical protein
MWGSSLCLPCTRLGSSPVPAYRQAGVGRENCTARYEERYPKIPVDAKEKEGKPVKGLPNLS